MSLTGNAYIKKGASAREEACLKPREGLATESVSAGLRLAPGRCTAFQVYQLQSITHIRPTGQ